LYRPGIKSLPLKQATPTPHYESKRFLVPEEIIYRTLHIVSSAVISFDPFQWNIFIGISIIDE